MNGRVGVDLVPFGRVRRLVEPGGPGTAAVLARMLSAAELRLTRTASGPDIPGIAGRLAAKEAVFKLFHAPGQTLPWLGIEILKDDGGWPVVHLGGRAARLARAAGIGHIEVSIAHDDPFAIAVAHGTPLPAAAR
ncbi:MULTISPECIES: holo-ACP synthase [Streptomycetaceae]|uniref:Holo-[acyl-carrier-protein] synthase n=1 Tax=Streptantibioticus cattleyicolor (strain ATCC 35852 / DSM 46488 / JCM 4925 / NBRC 14057 / NRRL 8057) TaxID=1003195 RepID=F8JRD7_STREN|nr:4'-phosphopantetheinyl transferase superfamily protein [Streptantibioticus cattleyicolor]AEW96637.1 holo-[acyl-carrier-protein] synthase [Streptantibioticus cattleyicolor NRRL 8057 = DSM 46488]MYS61130.1 4'-phosphopantetheinyl transferase superfamily protein [Streptomyces sp. SID5468]CCB76975.1 putative Holo-[acyl-carrier-protein] synthase [Streptantibioticus cattleyicolor NRRL 8057 = DSM 46488]